VVVVVVVVFFAIHLVLLIAICTCNTNQDPGDQSLLREKEERRDWHAKWVKEWRLRRRPMLNTLWCT